MGQNEETTARSSAIHRFRGLAVKELRETLRDRRTIVTLMLMPLIIYPLLSTAFQKFLMSNIRPESRQVMYNVGVSSIDEMKLVGRFLVAGEALIKSRLADADATDAAVDETVDADKNLEDPADAAGLALGKLLDQTGQKSEFNPQLLFLMEPDLEQAVEQRRIDVGLRVRRVQEDPGPDRFNTPIDCEIIAADSGTHPSNAVLLIERMFRAVNEEAVAKRFKELGVTTRVNPIQTTHTSVETFSPPLSFSLSVLVPLILTLMTITGAVYPAIDLTAGERERGTLETLIAAPVPRMGLLLAKYVAVLTVAMLTASINLVAMTVTIVSGGLGPLLFGEAGLSVELVIQIFALLVLFAAFFSAVILALTSFARSFKEAQAYLIPLMLLSIAPGLLTMMPGLELNGILAVVPLANIVLLTRDLFEGASNPMLTGLVVGSTAVYAGIAIALAARIFGTDAILYGSSGTWSDWMHRPKQRRTTPSLASALTCLALMFPAYHVLGNLLAQQREASMDSRLLMMSAVTIFLFGGFPLVAALLNRVRLRDGFRLQPTKAMPCLGAAILGVSLWPFAHEIVVWQQAYGWASLNLEQFEQIRRLLDQWRDLSPVAIVVSIGLVPPIFEELFFRGYLLGALLDRTTQVRAVLVSGVLFGIFHVLVTDALAVERLIPSTLLGIILGAICVRTRSVFPGMLLHACHNSFLVLVSYYKDDLARWGIGFEQQAHLPMTWLLGAGVLAIGGFLLIRLPGRPALSRSANWNPADA